MTSKLDRLLGQTIDRPLLEELKHMESQITTLTNENKEKSEIIAKINRANNENINEKKQLEEKLEQYKNSEIMTEVHKECARNGANIAYENAKLKKVIDEIVECNDNLDDDDGEGYAKSKIYEILQQLKNTS